MIWTEIAICLVAPTGEIKIGEARMADWVSDVRYLRRKAQQFRDLASEYDSVISERLLAIAEELDRRADEIEQQKGG
jgi:hypothetical protein